jgi:hypothetical protein
VTVIAASGAFSATRICCGSSSTRLGETAYLPAFRRNHRAPTSAVARSRTSPSPRPISRSSSADRTSQPRDRKPATTSAAMFSSVRRGNSSGLTQSSS